MTKQTIKTIFLPALLLSIILGSASVLFHLLGTAMIGAHLDSAQVLTLKTAMIFPQVILALALLIVSQRKPFENVFKWTLATLTGIVSLLAGLVFFQEQLQLQGMTETLSPLFYIVSNLLSFNLFSLLIWGFINRLTTPSDGIKYYLIYSLSLMFMLGLVRALVTYLGLLLIEAAGWPAMALTLPAIALMVGALITFSWAWKRLPRDVVHPKEASNDSQTRFPFLSCAYLLAGSVMVAHLLNLIFKFQVKTELINAESYVEFMGHFSTVFSVSTVIISVFWVALGTWLLSTKGWRTTAFSGSMSILVGGILFFSASAVSDSPSWLNQGIYNGILSGTDYFLFFPLVQMLYLYLPYQARFRAKVVTEMVALPLMTAVPPLIVQGLLVAFASMEAITVYLQILAFVLMALLIPVSAKLMDKGPYKHL